MKERSSSAEGRRLSTAPSNFAARHAKKALLAGAAALILAASGYVGISYVAADRFSTDYPHTRVDRAPAVHAATYEDVAFRTVDGYTLRGWYFPVASDRVVVLLPGREDDRTWGGRYELIADSLVAAGYSVLMFDMRGHGSSDGTRYTMGYFERYDVVAAIDYLVARGFLDRDVALLGISMGAATELVTLPLRPGVGPVIVDSSYSDLAAVMRENLPDHFGLPSVFVPGIEVAARVAWGIDVAQIRPVDAVRSHPERAFLFIQCDRDDWVLPYHATALRAASANPASELWMASGCEHVGASTDHPDEYRERILAFLAREFARSR
jgi:pimeloyl-ACP methyl ester carboxylesterase